MSADDTDRLTPDVLAELEHTAVAIGGSVMVLTGDEVLSLITAARTASEVAATQAQETER